MRQSVVDSVPLSSDVLFYIWRSGQLSAPTIASLLELKQGNSGSWELFLSLFLSLCLCLNLGGEKRTCHDKLIMLNVFLLVEPPVAFRYCLKPV